MSYYKLDINGNIDLSDYSNINDYMDVVSEEDSLLINLIDDNKENFDIICSMLIDKGFNIIDREQQMYKYKILANKKPKDF
ncbi:hypothetical protein [Clostridium rectalis]|uniref:hypothetical protein n=1 Tax=Clostridium rectalis TaxID=2040295 RepID=UPI000F63B176|nr:hypothetical protein [Clostridium rectalis]